MTFTDGTLVTALVGTVLVLLFAAGGAVEARSTRQAACAAKGGVYLEPRHGPSVCLDKTVLL